MKFWKKKDKIKSTNPFDNDDDFGSFSTEYSQTPTAVTYTEPTPSRSSSGGSRYSTPAKANNPLSSRNYSEDRQNLFGGYTDPTNRYDSSGQEDHYGSSKLAETDDDQEVVEIQNKIRNVKQESLASTRNALQKIGETESAASNTMNMLGTQSSMRSLFFNLNNTICY